MSNRFNIYCDESCHLEHDGIPVMVLGAIWCPVEKTREVAQRVREIKVRHGLRPGFEFKWSKVSPAKLAFYLDILDYFFDDSNIHFRALVVPDKSRLRHAEFGQDHDVWYYKMYFTMLKALLHQDARYRIYLDVKDTNSASRVRELHRVLSRNFHDWWHEVIEHVQCVRSHEIDQIQLADLLIGIVSYANRNLSGSEAKLALVDRMRNRSKKDLMRSTPLGEEKVNLFHWKPQEVLD